MSGLREKLGVGALLMLNALLVASLAGTGASAHTANFFLPWAPNHLEQYYMDDDVPNDMRPGLHEGLAEWSDRVGGNAPAFDPDGERNATLDWQALCAGPSSTVFVRGDIANEVGQGTLGATLLCPGAPQAPNKFIQIYATDAYVATLPGSNGWWVHASSPPNQRWDLRSVATHEAGHAAGFWYGYNGTGHFGEFDAACPDSDNSTRNTMCPGRQADLGTSYLRSLAGHDLHTLQAAY